jgi:methylmalonyl-CoA/ethylmalonyl-CoA epimerase
MARKINQIGIIVKDMDAAAEFYKKFLGVDQIGTLDVPDATCELKGNPCTYHMIMGFIMLGDLQIELIQEVEGPSPYSEFIARHGEGIQHLGYYIEDLDAELMNAAADGIEVYARGEINGTRWAYLDTEIGGRGVIQEFIEIRKHRPARKK